MWPRLQLDIGWGDLALGLGATFARRRAPRLPPDAFACLSVRTGFDLLLRALALPPGSEVLMTGLTIPHMPALVEHHGLVPVPLDLDPGTLAPSVDEVAARCTARTRLLVVAHLFGGRVDLDPLMQVARERDLLLVEDAAQDFRAEGCAGHPGADVTLFSFGTIKTATALGGAVVRVSDDALRARMVELERAYPAQSRRAYGVKVLRALVLKFLGMPTVYGGFTRALGLLGRDLDDTLQRAVAGFPGRDLAAALRRRPAPALLRLLDRRLRCYPVERIASRAAAGRGLAARLPPEARLLGGGSLDPTHWVLAVVAPDPDRLVDALREGGFDATTRSSLVALPPSGSRVSRAFARSVFVPCSPRMGTDDLSALVEAVAAATGPDATVELSVAP